MIIYNPLDGQAISYPIKSNPKHCFLMTRLGNPVPEMVAEIRAAVEGCCQQFDYQVIDAQARVTGRDFLLKIWHLIASAPLSVGVLHEDIPPGTQANIFYEVGVAQAQGKETIIIKSPGAAIPTDFVRTEYITFDDAFTDKFIQYLESVQEMADYYEIIADQLENNPVLALDYLRRAFLIAGDARLKEKANSVIDSAALRDRAANSVELLAAAF